MYIDQFNIFLSYSGREQAAFSDRVKAPRLSDSGYEAQVERFFLIDFKKIYILDNRDAPINKIQALELTHAMLLGKPIILLDIPSFSPGTPLLFRNIISSRLSKLLITNIALFDNDDLITFLKNISGVYTNYSLTKSEVILIKAHRRAHFRDLLRKS